MLTRVRTHLRAHVIGYLALFVALGGVAQGLPGSGSVDKNDLRKAVVKAKNIKKNAVTGAKVKEQTLNFRCRGGKIEVAAMCFDRSDRPADDWLGAAEDCGDEGGFLPSTAEYIAAVSRLGLSVPFPEYWTSIRYEDNDGADLAMIYRTSTGITFNDGAGNTNTYRCQFPLVRR